MNWIIASGNVADGFVFYGPFADPDKAIADANEHQLGDWTLAKLRDLTSEADNAAQDEADAVRKSADPTND